MVFIKHDPVLLFQHRGIVKSLVAALTAALLVYATPAHATPFEHIASSDDSAMLEYRVDQSQWKDLSGQIDIVTETSQLPKSGKAVHEISVRVKADALNTDKDFGFETQIGGSETTESASFSQYGWIVSEQNTQSCETVLKSESDVGGQSVIFPHEATQPNNSLTHQFLHRAPAYTEVTPLRAHTIMPLNSSPGVERRICVGVDVSNSLFEDAQTQIPLHITGVSLGVNNSKQSIAELDINFKTNYVFSPLEYSLDEGQTWFVSSEAPRILDTVLRSSGESESVYHDVRVRVRSGVTGNDFMTVATFGGGQPGPGLMQAGWTDTSVSSSCQEVLTSEATEGQSLIGRTAPNDLINVDHLVSNPVTVLLGLPVSQNVHEPGAARRFCFGMNAQESIAQDVRSLLPLRLQTIQTHDSQQARTVNIAFNLVTSYVGSDSFVEYSLDGGNTWLTQLEGDAGVLSTNVFRAGQEYRQVHDVRVRVKAGVTSTVESIRMQTHMGGLDTRPMPHLLQVGWLASAELSASEMSCVELLQSESDDSGVSLVSTQGSAMNEAVETTAFMSSPITTDVELDLPEAPGQPGAQRRICLGSQANARVAIDATASVPLVFSNVATLSNGSLVASLAWRLQIQSTYNPALTEYSVDGGQNWNDFTTDRNPAILTNLQSTGQGGLQHAEIQIRAKADIPANTGQLNVNTRTGGVGANPTMWFHHRGWMVSPGLSADLSQSCQNILGRSSDNNGQSLVQSGSNNPSTNVSLQFLHNTPVNARQPLSHPTEAGKPGAIRRLCVSMNTGTFPQAPPANTQSFLPIGMEISTETSGWSQNPVTFTFETWYRQS